MKDLKIFLKAAIALASMPSKSTAESFPFVIFDFDNGLKLLALNSHAMLYGEIHTSHYEHKGRFLMSVETVKNMIDAIDNDQLLIVPNDQSIMFVSGDVKTFIGMSPQWVPDYPVILNYKNTIRPGNGCANIDYKFLNACIAPFKSLTDEMNFFVPGDNQPFFVSFDTENINVTSIIMPLESC